MKTILVIDDEADIMEMVCTLLEVEGYKTMRANNGKQGLELVSRRQPDLVICDVMMPVLDGRQFCKRMHMNSDYRSIPIILMSAAAKFQSLVWSEYHYAALLEKPFDLDELLSTVQQVMQTAQK